MKSCRAEINNCLVGVLEKHYEQRTYLDSCRNKGFPTKKFAIISHNPLERSLNSMLGEIIIWDTNPPSPRSAGFQNQVTIHLISRFISLLYSEWYEFGLSNNATWSNESKTLPVDESSFASIVFFSFFHFFLGPHLWHMEVPRLGVQSELQLPAYATATAMSDLSRICNLRLIAMPEP